MKFIGIDVSRDKLDCAVVDDCGTVIQRSRAFKNSADGVDALLKWVGKIASKGHARFVIEATAAYHEMASLRLAKTGEFVAIVNPFHVRSLARGLAMLSKSDAIDALVLAQYGRLAKLRRWVPPAAQLVDIQALLLRLDAIESDLLREQNRREQAAARESATLVIGSIDASIKFLKRQRKSIEFAISKSIETAPGIADDVERLRSIPGVGEKTANRMATMLRMHDFKSAREVAAFCGLVPVEHKSGTSVYRKPRLSKAGNPRMRAALYMVAVVAMRLNPDVKALYDRLVGRGKAKMAALGACMRKIVQICFGVLKSGKTYAPQAVVRA